MPVADIVSFQVSPTTAPYATPSWVTDLEWRTIEITHARQGGPTGQCVPSRCTVTVDNADGRWDPSTGLGGATWAGNVHRWMRARILVLPSFFPTERFHGFVEDVQCFSDEHDAYAVVTMVDQLGLLGEHNLESLERPAEMTGTRAQAIFAAAGLPSLVLLQQTGTVVVEAATLSGNALAAAQECARAEGGHLWCPGAGTRVFTDRHYFYDTATLSNFLLSADLIKAVKVAQGLGSFMNVAEGASSGASGLVQKFGSAATNHPPSTARVINTAAVWDADAKASAEWLQRHGNFSGSRVMEVTCDVLRATSTAVRDALWFGTLKWLDTVQVQFTPVHGAAIDQICWVESESHRISARTDTWTVTLGLSPYQTDYANRSAEFVSFGETFGSLVPGV